MPSSLPCAPSAATQGNKPEFRYQTPIAYKSFEKFLKQKLTISDRLAQRNLTFTLEHLFSKLEVYKVYLKGSTQWRSETIHPDIDLQFSPQDNDLPDNYSLNERIKAFTKEMAKSGGITPSTASPRGKAKQAVWISRFSQEFADHWHRQILSLGYPNPLHSKLDLNNTSQRVNAYDTLNASRAVYFDTKSRQAHQVSDWSPKLINWLNDIQVLWFNPDIDGGLNRLSYRLSQSPASKLLQPGLAEHYLAKASKSEISSVLIRLLARESQANRLTTHQLQHAWSKIMAALGDEGDTPVATELKAQIQMWGQDLSVSEIQSKLGEPTAQTKLVQNLENASRVGIDFKSRLRDFLESGPDFRELLGELIDAGLGIELMEATRFFHETQQWKALHDIPEDELSVVFKPYLEEVIKTKGAHVAQAEHMKGWLDGDEISTLHFLIDKIPEVSRQQPASRLQEPIGQALLDLLDQSAEKFWHSDLPERVSGIGLKPHYLSALVTRLQPLRSHLIENLDAQHPSRAILAIYVHLSGVIPPKLSLKESEWYQDAKAYGHTHQLESSMNQFFMLYKQVTPPLLKSVVNKKGSDFKVQTTDIHFSLDLQNKSLRVGSNDLELEFRANQINLTGNRLHQVSSHVAAYCWADGTIAKIKLFLEDDHIQGVLSSSGELQTTMQSSLIRQGRAIYHSLWPEQIFEPMHVFAEGLFNGKQLKNAKGFPQALKSFDTGMIQERPERSLGASQPTLEYTFSDGRPIQCTGFHENLKTQSNVNMVFSKTTPSPEIALSQEFGVRPFGLIEQVHHHALPDAQTMVKIIHTPWNESTGMLEGEGLIQIEGVIASKWRGNIQQGGTLLSPATLQLKEPAKTLQIGTEQNTGQFFSEWFLQLAPKLVGRNLVGDYDFQPTLYSQGTPWPNKGEEGFIDNLPVSEESTFSGYIDSNAKLLGMLKGKWFDQFHRVNIDGAMDGNFLLNHAEQTESIKRLAEPLGLIREIDLTLPDGRSLSPHGFALIHLINVNGLQNVRTSGALFFNGLVIPCSTLDRRSHEIYEAPEFTQCFIGSGIELLNQTSRIEMLFNAPDGTGDICVIRPENHDEMPNHQIHYFSSTGFHAKLLVVNEEHRLGTLYFPNKVSYQGKIGYRDSSLSTYGPFGTGRLTMGEFTFEGKFNFQGEIEGIQGRDETSQARLNEFASPGVSLSLNQLVYGLSNGKVSYERDMKPQMKIHEPLGLALNNDLPIRGMGE